jgi:hypothetical protein
MCALNWCLCCRYLLYCHHNILIPFVIQGISMISSLLLGENQLSPYQGIKKLAAHGGNAPSSHGWKPCDLAFNLMGRLLKWSGKENVNLYLYVIPVIFTLGTSAPCSYITPKAKCRIHIHPPHVECLLLHIAKKIHQIQLSKNNIIFKWWRYYIKNKIESQ